MSKLSAQKPRLGDYFSQRTEPGWEGLPTLSVTLRDGLVFRDDLDRKTDTSLEHHEHLLARKGDIAYNMMRMWQGASGRAATDGLVSPAYVVLSPTDKIDSRFAAHWFKSPRMIYLFWAYSHGLTEDRLRLYYDDFAEIPAAPPPLPDQRRIAAILDEWDNAIASAKKLVEVKRLRKKALMQRLFGDAHNPFWVKGPKLSKLVKIEYGAGVPTNLYDIHGKAMVIGTQGLLGRVIEGQQCGPAIIVGRKGTLNRPFYVEDGQEFSAIDTTFILKGARSLKCLFHYLTFVNLAKLNEASGVPSVSSTTLATLPVPALSEKASEFLDEADTAITLAVREVAQLHLQKRGLMQKLLSGDWPVPASIDRLLPGELCIEQAVGAEAKRAEATG